MTGVQEIVTTPRWSTKTPDRRTGLPWSQLDVDRSVSWTTHGTTLHGRTILIAAVYKSEITSILDRLIPFRMVTCRPTPSEPWFDNVCLGAKRLSRRLERAMPCGVPEFRLSEQTDVLAAKTTQRRKYRDLRRSRRSAFCCSTVERDRQSPKRLWRWVNQRRGRGRQPASAGISVDVWTNLASFSRTMSTASI